MYVKVVAKQRHIHRNEDIEVAVVLVDENRMHHVIRGRGLSNTEYDG